MTKSCLVAIVTGGANGIGEATVRCFARKGYTVIIADMDHKNGRKIERELKDAGYPVQFCQTDIGCEDSIKEMVEQTILAWGVITTLVNCAGCFIMKGIDASLGDWETCLKVNVIGYALCAKYAVPHMRADQNPSIINISSISALIAQPNFVTYSAAKGAVSSMTRCMALDLASKGIRVNAVCPGTIWTKSNEEYTMKNKGLDRKMADLDPEMGGRHILGRVGDPEEIASVVVFLASSSSTFITGANIPVDGGYTVL